MFAGIDSCGDVWQNQPKSICPVRSDEAVPGEIRWEMRVKTRMNVAAAKSSAAKSSPAASAPCRAPGAIATTLRRAGLRVTRQRLALARLLFGSGGPACDRHVSADDIHRQARDYGLKLSRATVYNTLHQFAEMGLLQEVTVESGRVWFDTNIRPHHHFYLEDERTLIDFAPEHLQLRGLPPPPAGAAISRVDVVVRIRRAPEKSN